MAVLPTVHLVHFYSSPGGIEVMSSRLLNSFRGYNFRVFVIRPGAEGQINVYEGADVPVCYGSRNNMYAMFRLWRYARSHKNEIFHLFNLGPFFLMAVRVAGARSIIYSIHGTRYWQNPWQRVVRKPLWNLAVSKNVIITSNSEYSKSVFREKVCSGAEVKVVYNPMSSSRFVPPHDSSAMFIAPDDSSAKFVPPHDSSAMFIAPDDSSAKFVPPHDRIRGTVPSPVSNGSGMMKDPGIMKIVYVGRLNSGKNLEKWVDVAVDLHRRLNRVTFEIYGTGPLSQALTDKIRSLEAEDYITLPGYRSDIENVFREANLLLFLSEYESFGNVVVESILCGTPVVASDIPSMREIFRDYPLFLVSTEGDLCGQIASRLQDYDSLADAAITAGTDFRERFSERAYISSLDKLYTSCNG